jgi:hypothetical protein
MVMVFAGVTFGGWTLLSRGRARTIWRTAFVIALIGGVAFTIVNLNLVRFRNELDFRERYRTDLTRVLADPAVKAGLRCGPLSTPNHKLIPDIRWVTGLDEDQVIARSDEKQRKAIKTGVALYVSGRYALLRQAFVSPLDEPETQVPMPGFRRVATSGYYGAYVRCNG